MSSDPGVITRQLQVSAILAGPTLIRQTGCPAWLFCGRNPYSTPVPT